jgi:hypothetical protein
MIIVPTLLQDNGCIVYLPDYCKRTLSIQIGVRSLFGQEKVTTLNIDDFALRAISSVPVVGTEQKFNQINRKPIAMLIAFFVGEFRRLR